MVSGRFYWRRADCVAHSAIKQTAEAPGEWSGIPDEGLFSLHLLGDLQCQGTVGAVPTLRAVPDRQNEPRDGVVGAPGARAFAEVPEARDREITREETRKRMGGASTQQGSLHQRRQGWSLIDESLEASSSSCPRTI